MVERDTVNILIDVRFILRANTLTLFHFTLIGIYLDLFITDLNVLYIYKRFLSAYIYFTFSSKTIFILYIMNTILPDFFLICDAPRACGVYFQEFLKTINIFIIYY
jgi:hypothetical protein